MRQEPGLDFPSGLASEKVCIEYTSILDQQLQSGWALLLSQESSRVLNTSQPFLLSTKLLYQSTISFQERIGLVKERSGISDLSFPLLSGIQVNHLFQERICLVYQSIISFLRKDIGVDQSTIAFLGKDSSGIQVNHCLLGQDSSGIPVNHCLFRKG